MHAHVKRARALNCLITLLRTSLTPTGDISTAYGLNATLATTTEDNSDTAYNLRNSRFATLSRTHSSIIIVKLETLPINSVMPFLEALDNILEGVKWLITQKQRQLLVIFHYKEVENMEEIYRRLKDHYNYVYWASKDANRSTAQWWSGYKDCLSFIIELIRALRKEEKK